MKRLLMMLVLVTLLSSCMGTPPWQKPGIKYVLTTGDGEGSISYYIVSEIVKEGTCATFTYVRRGDSPNREATVCGTFSIEKR